MARAHAKALRIGIIQRGKIVEERLLRKREPVSIGTGARNTFVVPQSDLPESFTLFRVQGGEFALAFDDAMDGRVHAPAGAADFGALAAEGLAKRVGDVHVLPLREEQWGKARLGEVTVLFQFVRPPPEPPRPTLPRAARGNRFRSMDPLFVLVLLASLALHVSAYAGLARAPVREEVTIEEIPDRFAKLLIPERRAEPAAAPEAPRKGEGDAAEKKVEEAKPPEKKGGEGDGEAAGDRGEASAAARKAARGAAIARAVQGKGLLRVLGALGPAARGGGAAAAVFGGEGGSGGLGDVAAALSGAGSVAVAGEGGAGGGGLGGRRGAGGSGPASIGDLATGGGGGAKVALGAKAEVRVSASVAAEDAEIDSPDLDQAKLGQFVRARMGALKACYESQLKRNPALRGKIRIRFSVLETGAIADAVAVENGLGSPEVAACIVATLRTWRTPFRPTGPVTVEYPFVFAAAN
jgi:hypothetical protein